MVILVIAVCIAVAFTRSGGAGSLANPSVTGGTGSFVNPSEENVVTGQQAHVPEEAEIPEQQGHVPEEAEIPEQRTHVPEEIKIPEQQAQGTTETDAPLQKIKPVDLETLKSKLVQFISEHNGRYGLYFKNLISGQSFGVCEKEPFTAASTTKLPMNLLLYRRVADGEINLDSKLTYLQEDFEAGTGVIQSLPFGTEYTVRETARLSIVFSDNCGINMIIRLLGVENIRKYMQDLGGTIQYERGHSSCPYDLALYAEELYRCYQQTPDLAGLLMGDLQNTEWNDRINRLLPADVKVPHKIGSSPGVCNDVGIVFASEPYVLAVMSDGVAQDAAADVIAQLSKRIYDAIENSGN
ncbi:MAG: serine hydrolase [Thermoclostridium sp.]|nr:serine hydrolase [Thermoclostridium sp.]